MSQCRGNTHCIFKKEILDFFSSACAPPALGTVAGGCQDPTVALSLIYLCHLPPDSILPVAGAGSHHLCASLSPSCARTRASYKCIQYSTIRAEPKNSTGSWGSRTNVKVCGSTITFKGLTVSRQVFVHNPTEQSSMQGGERMVGIERKNQLSFGCREGFMDVVTPGSAKG